VADPYALDEAYDAFPRIEDEFLEMLDGSLAPRSPDFLYDLVAGLPLPAGAKAIDVGCGEGAHAVELARRFGLEVTGIDPVEGQLERCRRHLAEAAGADPSLAERVSFARGHAEQLDFGDGAFDLVWCRDVLMYATDLERAFGELRRVLRAGGAAVVYHSKVATDRLAPAEAEMLGVDTTPARLAAAIAGAGFHVEHAFEIGIELAEYFEETRGSKSRRLRHLARMLRAPERYVGRFGQAHYDFMLADAYWHVYHMIGKMATMVYLLTAG
jgi:SAM-dependent methyltransferase